MLSSLDMELANLYPALLVAMSFWLSISGSSATILFAAESFTDTPYGVSGSSSLRDKISWFIKTLLVPCEVS